MPTALVVQSQLELVEDGVGPTMVAADATGHTYVNPMGREPNVWVENSGGVALTLTVLSARDSNFGPYPDKVLTIDPATLTVLPAFDASRFTDPATGIATFTLSTAVGVTVAAVEGGKYFRDS